MFRQIQPTQWADAAALLSLVVAATIFAGILIRIFRMPPKKTDHLSHLPLEDDTHPSHETKK